MKVYEKYIKQMLAFYTQETQLPYSSEYGSCVSLVQGDILLQDVLDTPCDTRVAKMGELYSLIFKYYQKFDRGSLPLGHSSFGHTFSWRETISKKGKTVAHALLCGALSFELSIVDDTIGV